VHQRAVAQAGEPADGAERRRRRSSCAVACTLDLLGDRWTLLIVRDLLAGKTRYGEFLASEEKIPTNILAERLKRLEQERLVERIPYRTRPPRAEYHLTEEGRQLGGVLDAMATWGMAHFPGSSRLRLPGSERPTTPPSQNARLR
jgi:DNA-binding HxlR family transcriptional regulator